MGNETRVRLSKQMMRTRSLLIGAVVPLVASCGGASPYRDDALSRGEVPDAVYFIIDTSESMNDRVSIVNGGSDRKIEIAARAVSGLASELNGLSQVGLRTYPDPRGRECNGGKLLVEIEEKSGRTVQSRVAGVRGESTTPTAEALIAAATDVRDHGSPVTVVLVSDGYSSCLEPCMAVEELSINTDWQIITVGFDLGDEGSEELRCIAGASGGKYVNAADGEELQELFGDPDRLFSVTG